MLVTATASALVSWLTPRLGLKSGLPTLMRLNFTPQKAVEQRRYSSRSRSAVARDARSVVGVADASSLMTE